MPEESERRQHSLLHVTNSAPHQHARRLRVYLVEDSTIIVGLLRDLLAVDPAMEVVGESTNAKAAIAAAHHSCRRGYRHRAR